MADGKKARRPRSGNREGRPWQRPDGRWVVRVWPPGSALDQKPRYVYGKTAAEARGKKRDLEGKLAKGLPEDKDQTLGTYLSRWLDVTLAQYVSAGRMAESTMDSYRDNARNHIIPLIGHVKLADLSAPVVREWQHRLRQKPSGRPRLRLRKGETELPEPGTLSPRTVAYCHAILHKAVQDAVRDEVAGLHRNVVSLVEPPKVRGKREIAPPTKDEARALLVAASQDRWWCYWLVVLALGLRRGEGLGMRWSDLDLDGRKWKPGLAVRRTRGEADPATGRRKGKLVASELKTEASSVTLAIPASAAEALKEWQREQRKMRLKSPAWADHGLVFTTAIGTAIEPRNVNRQWLKVCAAAGTRPIRPHDLRHACATYLLAAGVDVKTVSGTLRHGRLATTEIYLHMLEDVQRSAADTMDEILADLRRPSRKKAT